MRRLALSAGAVFAVAATVLTTAVSQQSAQPPPAPQATFKATARIVNVNVVVRDSRGNPITGLSKDDFELFDNGKPQNISFFAAIKNIAPAPTAPLAPDTYTNEQPTEGAPPSVMALLVDLQHSDWAAQHYLIYHLQEFLRKLHPEDHIAIYLLTADKALLLHDFTQDSSDLIAAIQLYDLRHSGPKDQRIKASARNLSELDRLLSGGDTQFRFDQWGSSIAPHPVPRVQTINTLIDIARHLASAPGRKSLVWLYGADFNKSVALGATELLPDEAELQHQLAGRLMGSYSWPHRYQGVKAFLLGPNGPDPEYRALRDVQAGLYSLDLVPQFVRIFNDSGIAVYPVDAAGLQTKGFGGFDDLGFRNPNSLSPLPATIHSDPLNPPINWEAMEDDKVHGSMSSMADRTGGRAWYNRNDLETGIEHALEDGRYSYELAYYPDHNDWRGEWRKIKVKLKDPDRFVEMPTSAAQELKRILLGEFGTPHLLARGGYYAFPEAKPAQQRDRKEMLMNTAQSAGNVDNLPFTARVVPLPGSGESEVLLFLNIDAHNILTQEAESRWRANFELLFFQLGQRPTTLSRPTASLRRHPEPVLYKRSEAPGTIDVPVKNYVLELNKAEYQNAMKTGMATSRRLKLEPGATTLVIVVHDKNSDAVGSVHIPLERYTAALPPAS